MKVLLIPAFNILNGKVVPYVPYGLLLLQATACKHKNVEVDIAGYSPELLQSSFLSTDEVVECFLETTVLSGYMVYGFSTVCDSAHYSIDIAAKIKERHPNSWVIMGGPYVTKLSIEVLTAYKFIDAVFVGESEKSFHKFIENVSNNTNSLLNIPGVRERGSSYVGEGVIEDLNALPLITDSPDYFKFILRTREYEGKHFSTPIEATRGCPLKCSFCSTRQIWGAKVRRKSANRLISEMETVAAITNDNFFSLIGDNIGVPRNPFMRFCDEMIEAGNAFKWAISLKLDKLEQKHLTKMWGAGCRGMFVGVESASQDTLNKVNKAANVEKEIEAITIAIQMGYEVETSLIIGFPWETMRDIKETYNLHCQFIKQGVRKSQILILSPIPGTDIVQNETVRFAKMESNFSHDSIPLSSQHRAMIEQNPVLFSHFGYYDTPNVSRRILKAYRDAASHVAALHAEKRNHLQLHQRKQE